MTLIRGGGDYPSSEVQSVYSTAPVDWATTQVGGHLVTIGSVCQTKQSLVNSKNLWELYDFSRKMFAQHCKSRILSYCLFLLTVEHRTTVAP